MTRERLNRLTDRWRLRHEARREAAERADALPTADPVREARAAGAFPWRHQTPDRYAAEHGADMAGYTYDAYRYRDQALETWLHELGRLLRERRAAEVQPAPAENAEAEAAPE